MTNCKVYSLIFIRRNTEVLLGMKVRGLGAGLWNGFGGKLERGETLHEGALRELKEESSLEAQLEHVGTVTYLQDGRSFRDIVHIFTSFQFKGQPVESEEMAPIKWFHFNRMPYEQMWPDAPKWIPLLMQDCYFTVEVTYDNNNCIIGISKHVMKSKYEFLKTLECEQ